MGIIKKIFLRSPRLVLSALLAFVSVAIQAEQLLETTTTWEGGDIVYPGGDAEVTSIILKIAEGEEAPFHCHPVPTLGYVLSGTVDVETRDGKTRRINAGESVVEVLRTVHRGRSVGGPVEILVFYAGATDIPNTVLPAVDPDHQYCNE